MVTHHNYSSDEVQAAHSVLVEVMHVLGRYREDIVLVGGWVPPLLCPSAETPHVGSMDVDLALDHRNLTEAGYQTILKLLLARGYEQDAEQPYIFRRTIEVAGRKIPVQVDFLGGEYGGTGRRHRTQRIQDLHVRKARGADLAFDAPVKVTIEGALPGGAKDSVTVRVASVVPFLIMKSMALPDRLKEKDSYDIYYCIRNYPGGAEAVVEEFRPLIENGLVKEGLKNIAKHFAAPESVGPTHVVDFQDIADPEEKARIRRDAFEQVHFVLEQLGFVTQD
jgi:hypothetical protein